ncbi:hypothetical protein D3C87_1609670 [compost metagenome]
MGYLKACFERRIQQRIAIRGLHRINPGQVRVLRFHQALDRIALAALPAVQAQHPVQAAVKFDHVMAASLVVQGIDILGDQPANLPGALQAGQGFVGLVRPRLAHPWPAEHRPRPIAAPGFGGREEFLVHHR